jgi:hypothetical protein
MSVTVDYQETEVSDVECGALTPSNTTIIVDENNQ